MSGSVNKTILIGNLGQDPEIRHTQDGSKIVTLSLATSESWTSKQTGERQTKTEWHRICVFNPHVADVCEKYLQKGSKVYIEGSLQTRKWTDQSGTEKYTTEVVIQKFKGELTLLGGGREAGQGQASPPPAGNGGGYPPPPADDLDLDEIPF